MSRAVWLTWKMHRFEVIAGVLLIGLLAISAWIMTGHITSLGLSDACWPRDADGNYATNACDSLMNDFYSITSSEGGFVRIGLALVAPIVGLILGVPIVARELELRTTSFAWSLQASRSHWLASRALPMLLVAMVAFVVLGIMGSMFFDTLAVGRQGAALTEVASGGAALVARGLMAVGVALLVGALTGRTMPAFIIAAIVVVAWSVMGVTMIQAQLSHGWAVWTPSNDDSWQTGQLGYIAYVDHGNFDTTKPGEDGQPGARFDFDTLDREAIATCGNAPDDDSGESAEFRAWADCADPIYQRGNDAGWNLTVPASRYGDYVAVDTLASLLVGGLAILLTFPVVARRRPS